MEGDQRKRSRAADGGGSGGGGERKKVREAKGKEVEIDPPVVVPPPTEEEVDEFFAILRRMREAVKYFDKDKDVGKLPDPLREADAGGKGSVKKRTGADLLDLNTVPDESE
ncbi:hypothetical protein SSX86_018431 [Deinandra increscens subsp. villosa]|uniref:Uncharacterized protein n=1 Tax=Deinandra increscens subsp. villosa TaxID=3103831 RepID=A0AAP0CSC9_9ASTR